MDDIGFWVLFLIVAGVISSPLIIFFYFMNQYIFSVFRNSTFLKVLDKKWIRILAMPFEFFLLALLLLRDYYMPQETIAVEEFESNTHLKIPENVHWKYRNFYPNDGHGRWGSMSCFVVSRKDTAEFHQKVMDLHFKKSIKDDEIIIYKPDEFWFCYDFKTGMVSFNSDYYARM